MQIKGDFNDLSANERTEKKFPNYCLKLTRIPFEQNYYLHLHM